MRSVAAALLVVVLRTSTACAGYTAVDLYTLTEPAGVRLYGVPTPAHGASAAGQVVAIGLDSATSRGVALMYTASGAPINLTPLPLRGNIDETALGTDGTHQVGVANLGDLAEPHAILWSGTSASAVDLNPAGFHDSTAVGVFGTQQVGFGTTATTERALLWNGTADSAVALTPEGPNLGEALATDGHHQVGRFRISQGVGSYLVHAVMWSGTAASMVDLNPAGFSGSVGLGVGGDQQVGWIVDAGGAHAALWTGSAESVVNLHPEPGAAFATATNGRQQAGEVDNQAVVWSGTADSMVNLHSLLPPGNWTGSSASSIDSQGNVFGIAYQIYYTNDGIRHAIYHAIEWQNVPEPGTGTLLLVGASGMLWRRR